MSRKTDAVVARTIGIDTGKNTLHLIVARAEIPKEHVFAAAGCDIVTVLFVAAVTVVPAGMVPAVVVSTTAFPIKPGVGAEFQVGSGGLLKVNTLGCVGSLARTEFATVAVG